MTTEVKSKEAEAMISQSKIEEILQNGKAEDQITEIQALLEEQKNKTSEKAIKEIESALNEAESDKATEADITTEAKEEEKAEPQKVDDQKPSKPETKNTETKEGLNETAKNTEDDLEKQQKELEEIENALQETEKVEKDVNEKTETINSTENEAEKNNENKETIDPNDIEIDTKFETFLKTQFETGNIPLETLEKAQTSLNDPEARGLLNSIGSLYAINTVNSFIEPAAIGALAISTLSFGATAIAWIKYQLGLMAGKNIFLRYQNRHSDNAGKTANTGMLPFIGNFKLMRDLVKTNPELVNTFFADRFSRKSRNRIKEAQNKIQLETQKDNPSKNEIKYWKKQLKKWQGKEKQTIQSGLNFMPKWNKRADKWLINPVKKSWNFVTKPFRKKKEENS